MKIQFDARQQYEIDAVDAVLDGLMVYGIK